MPEAWGCYCPDSTDARGLAAALALGAEGINMGTRFLATLEAPVHDNVKRKLIEGAEVDTQLLLRPFRNTARFYRNSVAKQAAEIELRPGVQFEDVRDLVAGERGRWVFAEGDVEAGVWTVGMVMGLIDDIPSCKELITRIVAGAEEIIKARLSCMIV